MNTRGLSLQQKGDKTCFCSEGKITYKKRLKWQKKKNNLPKKKKRKNNLPSKV